jgi:hypothetical protein
MCVFQSDSDERRSVGFQNVALVIMARGSSVSIVARRRAERPELDSRQEQ